MTFSIVARCNATRQFGVAVSSSSPAVAARCAHARAGVGAVASQNVTDPRLGSRTLDALQDGMNAPDAVAAIIAKAEHAHYRQILAIDAKGKTAIYSGNKTLGINAECEGENAAAAGNLLASKIIPEAMVAGFHESKGHLGDRLIAAMYAGLNAGGEAGDVHSAGMLIVDQQEWPLAELRCDWIEDGCPIAAIAAAWNVYKPQMDDYVTRALNPSNAPSYGVAGDE